MALHATSRKILLVSCFFAAGPSQAFAETTNQYQMPSSVEDMPTEAAHQTWSLFPGVYRSYDRRTSGAEVTLLKGGKGLAFGIESGHFRYIEAELAFWIFSLSTGPRWAEHTPGTQWQLTWAFPVLPIFPYGRWTSDHLHRTEYGLMLKIPLIGIDEWFR